MLQPFVHLELVLETPGAGVRQLYDTAGITDAPSQDLLHQSIQEYHRLEKKTLARR